VVPVAFSTGARIGRTTAEAIAAISTAGYGSALAGPPLIGFVAAHWSLRAGIAILAVSATIAAAIAWRSRFVDAKSRQET
jgi:hypothetical protein